MDDNKLKVKSFLEEIRKELRAHDISYGQVALETIKQECNGGRGYSEQKIKDMMAGRSTSQSDILTVMVSLIESNMKILERLAEGDITPLQTRLGRSRLRREELEAQWMAA